MANQLTCFTYEGMDIRTVHINGETWWAANDICGVFGESNRYRAMQSLHEDEKGYTQMSTPRGDQRTAIVSEAGLYALLFAMQPSKARGVDSGYIAEREEKLRKFRRWVTHEVLPSIRKHGLYAADDLLNNPDLFIRALTALKEERSKNATLAERSAMQEKQLAELLPKAGYFDVVLACKNAVAVSVIAKDYGWSAKRMNNFLHGCGVQFRQGETWLPYRKHAQKGYTATKTHLHPGKDGGPHSSVHTYWTQKGRLFIYEILKAKGHLPRMERGSVA
jgi:prophage antirepressor-like protein